MSADPAATARFLGAFLDELTRWGVRDVVVSPGSRSTPLSMCAYELSRRFPERLHLFVDVDERGAAFVALGLAKASGRPAAVICTSGTAVANYYPAVLEAESSRVPLIVLTGDRPPRLQGLGAPQTCDQLKAFGDHVRSFRQMPLPAGDDAAVAFARQAAREACLSANPFGLDDGDAPRLAGACSGGPVHLNYPFDEPLKPDLGIAGLFDAGRPAALVAGVVSPRVQLVEEDVRRIAEVLGSGRALVLAGEGSVANERDAEALLAWAHAYDLPLLADPLSGLRCFDDALVIDNYDTVLGDAGRANQLMPQVIVRFGRWPVSKRATTALAAARPVQIVVDPLETRDCNTQTNLFVPCAPVDFARSLLDRAAPQAAQHEFAVAWTTENDAAAVRIIAADHAVSGFEGAFVRRVVELAPAESCLFAANSMSIRALDTFQMKGDKCTTVLCNRGLNGIDGTVSTAIGAAQSFAQTTLLTGDLTLFHDLNALALQREVRLHHGGDQAASLVIVLLNNNGGGIFDMLPQQSTDPYFERLFLTPQDVDFRAAAQAFNVPYQDVETVAAFDEAYRGFLGTPGISLVEVRVPLSGLKERYAPYWS